MRRILALMLAVLLVASSAYAITWTKLWSSADDGSPYSGSDIGTMQSDVNSQVPTLTGNNSMTGNNTFSGTTTFSGTLVGVTGSAAHIITRGFELVWQSTTVVRVNTGTLYHNTTQVNKTTVTDLDITVAGDAIDGTTAQQATSAWRYVYCDASGNLKLWSVAPDKSDTAGNTDGTKIYYYYSATTTYYRCLGAIRLNATGAGEIDKFYQQDNLIMRDVPANISTTTSVSAWTDGSTAAKGDCSAAIPPISTVGIFGASGAGTGAPVAMWIRRNGATWATQASNAVFSVDVANSGPARGGYTSFTDSSQKVNFYQSPNSTSVRLDVEGFYINIR